MVSEAHGYGMMQLSCFAGFDPDAREDFDRVVLFYLAHPSEICPSMMVWQHEALGIFSGEIFKSLRKESPLSHPRINEEPSP